MMTILLLLAVLTVLFGAAALLTSDRPVLAEAPPDAADTGLPTGPVQPEDVAALRFSVAPRGYRMAEVDDVLDRLAAELADRDRRLTLLEATLTDGLPPAAPVPVPAPQQPQQRPPLSPQRPPVSPYDQ